MPDQPRFEDMLPLQTDPQKEIIRRRLLLILNSQGEILPSANSPQGKLWRLVNSPKSTLSECAEAIQTDPALAARIFRVANSGAFGVGCDNVNQAIMHLGLKFVREQVFNSEVFKKFAEVKLPPEWDLFWLRNIFVARVCEKIASVCGPTNGSEYLAGLTHDIGWLFLATNFPQEFTDIFSCGLPIDEAERGILPFGHAEISATIAARSLMPERAVKAVLDHHHPLDPSEGMPHAPGDEPEILGAILKVSDDIADSCGISMFGESGKTIQEIHLGAEMQWLNDQGKAPGLEPIAVDELGKAREIFSVYFADR